MSETQRERVELFAGERRDVPVHPVAQQGGGVLHEDGLVGEEVAARDERAGDSGAGIPFLVADAHAELASGGERPADRDELVKVRDDRRFEDSGRPQTLQVVEQDRAIRDREQVPGPQRRDTRRIAADTPGEDQGLCDLHVP